MNIFGAIDAGPCVNFRIRLNGFLNERMESFFPRDFPLQRIEHDAMSGTPAGFGQMLYPFLQGVWQFNGG